MTTPANPIFDRLTRDSKFPNLPQTIVLTIGLAVATSLVAFYVDPVGNVLNIFSVFMLIMFGPMLITGLATLTAARDSHSEAYDLLKMTPLTRPTIVWGYFWATLFRIRLLLALLIGVCVPATIIYQTVSFAPPAFPNSCHVLVPYDQTYPTSDNSTICVAADDPRVLASRAMGYLILPSIILSAIPLSMLGVALGLAGRRTVGATTVGAFVIMLVASFLLIGGLTLLGPAIGTVSTCITRCVSLHTWPVNPYPPLIYLAVLTLTTFGLDRLARRFV